MKCEEKQALQSNLLKNPKAILLLNSEEWCVKREE
jgi:hypothetical protein